MNGLLCCGHRSGPLAWLLSTRSVPEVHWGRRDDGRWGRHPLFLPWFSTAQEKALPRYTMASLLPEPWWVQDTLLSTWYLGTLDILSRRDLRKWQKTKGCPDVTPHPSSWTQALSPQGRGALLAPGGKEHPYLRKRRDTQRAPTHRPPQVAAPPRSLSVPVTFLLAARSPPGPGPASDPLDLHFRVEALRFFSQSVSVSLIFRPSQIPR